MLLALPPLRAFGANPIYVPALLFTLRTDKHRRTPFPYIRLNQAFFSFVCRTLRPSPHQNRRMVYGFIELNITQY